MATNAEMTKRIKELEREQARLTVALAEAERQLIDLQESTPVLPFHWNQYVVGTDELESTVAAFQHEPLARIFMAQTAPVSGLYFRLDREA